MPDCAKAAVSDPNRYEPDINPEYADFAEHYGCVILPCRHIHPKDNALLENMVRIVYSRIYARLRNRTFYSIGDLNEAIRELLDEHNNKSFQKMKLSRLELFEHKIYATESIRDEKLSEGNCWIQLSCRVERRSSLLFRTLIRTKVRGK